MTHNPNAVQERDGKWYWYDECWVDETGPFDTQDEAQIDCNKYWQAMKTEDRDGSV